MKDYSSIINLQRPIACNHKPMSQKDRAAQFAPFAALTGFDSMIEETKVQYDSLIDLGEDEINAINTILNQLKKGDKVSICYFKEDKNKKGFYQTVTETFKSFDEIKKDVVLSTRQKINMKYIRTISIITD